jgi:putative transposase
VEEVQAVRGQVSPSTGQRYPLTLICQVFHVARSSVYAAQVPPAPAGPPGKRGPKTRWSDAEIVTGIQAVLAASSFHGEGYRKIRVRLAHRGV